MSLARVKVWIPGDVLTAADLNSEFNNVINNPITLISPTTGAINFNLQSNTNFVLENVATTPTAATSGRIVYDTAIGLPKVDQGTVVRAIPLVLATALSTGAILVYTSSGSFSAINNGTSGQVLTVTSSNVTPSFQTPTAGSGGYTLLAVTTTSTAINNSTALNTFLTAPSVTMTTSQELVVQVYGAITVGVASSMTLSIVTSSETVATLGVPLNSVVSTVGDTWIGKILSSSLGYMQNVGAAGGNSNNASVVTTGSADFSSAHSISVQFAFGTPSASNTYTPLMTKLFKVG